MNCFDKITLGTTEIKAGRIGISSSFGADAKVFEAAFERGFNYFTWGTFIKGRSKEMKKAINNIVKKGKRDELVIAIYAYYHNSFLNNTFYKVGLQKLGIEYADELILGYYNDIPGKDTINNVIKLKMKGLIKSVGLSSHNRKVFPELYKEKVVDIFHVRYNAVNKGAETDIFPFINGVDKPGVVSYTATRWGDLLNPKKMPAGEKPLTAGDCYRFVLNNPMVDVCMMGVRNMHQFKDNMKELEKGPLTLEEIDRIRRIGDYIH